MGLMVAIPQIRWTCPLAMLACATLVLSAEASAQVPVASAATAQTATLTADAVFGFGSSTLSNAGTDSLSSLFNSLGGPQHVVRLTLVGHSDPIETPAHDPQLALARAAAIRALFVQQGVPADVIDVSGVADSPSNVKGCVANGSPTAIACYAGERRVELHALVNMGVRQSSATAETLAANRAPIQPVTDLVRPVIGQPDIASSKAAGTSGSPSPESGAQLIDSKGTRGSVPASVTSVTKIADANIPTTPATVAPPNQLEPITAMASKQDVVTLNVTDSGERTEIQDPAAQVQTWHLVKGELISKTLTQWAARVGWTVDWKYPTDIASPVDKTYTGDFITVAGGVIKTLHSNGALIYTHFYKGDNIQRVWKSGSIAVVDQ